MATPPPDEEKPTVDRYWLLTTTFYGNWLPGDPGGFVSRVRDVRAEDTRDADAMPPTREPRREHDVPGTPYDADYPGLYRHARQQLKGPPIRIDAEHARLLLEQFLQTATCRGWRLLAAAILANHVHLVVGVAGDPDPTKVLGDFKAYGSRALSKQWGKPLGETWWTYGGSKRKLVGESALLRAIAYVRCQTKPLRFWVAPGVSAHEGWMNQ
jgi:REP element-mobilizing transposase RayT